jgi:SOS-response transcriptional repressor LexA
MTVEQLAEMAGLSQPYLTRIEGAKRGLSVAIAERIAMALNVQTQEVLGIANSTGALPALGFAEDLEAYVPGPGELPVAKLRLNVTQMRVKTNCLSRLHIFAGDVVTVDHSAEAVENLEPLKIVVVQIFDPDPNVLKAVTVMRQFVPPSLLITNSAEKNERSLDLEADEVAIRGVVIGTQRRV